MSVRSRQPNPWDLVFRLRRAGRIEDALAALDEQWREERKSGDGATARLRASLQGELARVVSERGNVALAGDLIREALQDAPSFPDLHYQLGTVLLHEGDATGARRAFETALTSSPRYVAPALALVVLDAREGQLGEAIRALEDLARRRAPDHEKLFQDGLRQLREAEWEKAEPLLLKAYHQRDRELAEEQQSVGRLLENERPLDALREALRLTGRFSAYPDSHHAVGLSCLALEWLDDAAEAFGRALGVNPDFHEARVYLAWVMFACGQSHRAEAELDRVLDVEPEHTSAQLLLLGRGAAPQRRFEKLRSAGSAQT